MRRVNMRAVIAALAAAPCAAMAAGQVVQTGSGQIRGLQTTQGLEFLGIPYAAPPTGALRWRPPQPVASWSAVRDATTFAPPCAQPASDFGTASGSEDCLYLNVYAPAGANANLPVMLWIHGGAFTTGEGSDYDGTALQQGGRVIVVTINYRLGYFGFLAHPALAAENAHHASGDYGLMDQQAAMRWVRANIASFGGDPANVTIFGESAGGQSVIDHLASPSAASLFARAIIESGDYAVRLPTETEAEATGSTFGAALGCPSRTDASCLRALPAPAIIAAEAGSGLTSFEPNTGPAILPFQPTLAIGTGAYNHVPVLQGTNHDEARLFVATEYDRVSGPLTAPGYQKAIASIVGGTLAPLVAQVYPLARYPSADIAFSTLFTDAGFPCSAMALNDVLAKSVPTYAYEFADEDAARLLIPADPYMNIGAAHTTELTFIWPALHLALSPTGEEFTAGERTLSAQMIAAWTNFARNGNPNGPGVPTWPRHDPFTGVVEELAPGATAPSLAVRTDHKCGFWSPLLGIQTLIPPSALGSLG